MPVAIVQLIVALAGIVVAADRPDPDGGERCLACHGRPELRLRLESGDSYSLHVDARELGRSVHAELTCTTCHTNYSRESHGTGAEAGQSSEEGLAAAEEVADWVRHVRGHNRPAVSTCLRCHEKEFAEYRRSIHAAALQRGSSRAPMCTDCHGNHYIRRHDDLESSVSRANVPTTCSGCHADSTLMRKYGVTEQTAVTYTESFHGKKQQLGSTRVAACSSCHGFHDIRDIRDPASRVHPSRRAATCGECHNVLGERFASTFSHKPPSRTVRPLVYWVNAIFEWFAYAVILGLLVYTLADMRIMVPLVREQVRTQLSGEAVLHDKGRHFVRWDLHQRLQHLIMFTSVILLMTSGLPLHGSATPIAKAVVRFLGGADAAAVLHRVAGIGMSVSVAYHFLYLVALVLRGVRHTDMLPTVKDFVDFRQAFLQLLGRRKEPPAYGRYNFVEKFLYWAAGWGIIFMGLTGFVLWGATWFAEHFSPQFVELCAVLHSHEALIAATALLVFHLYFAHLRPDVFPMSKVWLTGEIDEIEMRERHSQELAELSRAESGESETAESPTAGEGR